MPRLSTSHTGQSDHCLGLTLVRQASESALARGVSANTTMRLPSAATGAHAAWYCSGVVPTWRLAVVNTTLYGRARRSVSMGGREQ